MPVSEAKLLWISPPSYQEALNDQPSPYEENGCVELWGFQDKTVSCSRCGVLCFFLENKASVSFSCLLKNGILSGHYILAYAGCILLNAGVYRQSSISFPHQTNCDNIFIKKMRSSYALLIINELVFYTLKSSISFVGLT